MHRRHFLAGSSIALSTPLVGCLGTDDGLVLENTNGPNHWPQLGYDAANTYFSPGVSGPTTDPEVVWDGFEEMVYPVADEHVYAGSAEENAIVSLDNEGSERWRESDFPGLFPQLSFNESYLFAVTREQSRTLHALDRDDGSVAWTVDLPNGMSGHSMDEEYVYLPSVDGIVAVDLSAGSIAWELDLDAELGKNRSWWTVPAVSSDHVITFGTDGNDGVHAIDRKTGELDWSAELDLPDDLKLWTQPTIGDTHVVVVATGPDHRLYAIDRESNEVDWSLELDGFPQRPPAYADGTLFVCYGDTDWGVKLEAIDVEDHSRHWTNEWDSFFNVQSPIVTPEMVYFAHGFDVSGIATGDGTEQWRVSLRDWQPRGLILPIVVDETVYVGLDHGKTGLVAIRDGN